MMPQQELKKMLMQKSKLPLESYRLEIIDFGARGEEERSQHEIDLENVRKFLSEDDI